MQVCRELDITQTTFYRWRAKYDVGVNELRELRDLRDENHSLRQIVTDLLLDKQRAVDTRAKKQ